MLVAVADKRMRCGYGRVYGAFGKAMRRVRDQASGDWASGPRRCPSANGMGRDGWLGAGGGLATRVARVWLRAEGVRPSRDRDKKIRGPDHQGKSQEMVDEMKARGLHMPRLDRLAALLGFCQDDRRIVGSRTEDDARIKNGVARGAGSDPRQTAALSAGVWEPRAA
jgi:hypothetical protein